MLKICHQCICYHDAKISYFLYCFECIAEKTQPFPVAYFLLNKNFKLLNSFKNIPIQGCEHAWLSGYRHEIQSHKKCYFTQNGWQLQPEDL